MTDKSLNITKGEAITKNTIFNMIGQAAPMFVAIFTMPVLIKALGTDRFGILTLAWMVIGYFNLFDLGLGRALTKLVAEKLGAGKGQEVPALVWTSLALMGLLWLIGAVAVTAVSPWLVHVVLKIPANLQNETLGAFYLLALSVPIVISTAGLRGILEAQQRFFLTNAVRIPMGLFTFLGPLLVLPFSKSLVAIVAVLLASRIIAWLVYLLLCIYVMPALRSDISFQRAAIGPLIRFGSWMTASNIVSPLMVYMDRLLIGALISVTAVAYYSTPWEVVTKLLVIPGALAGVLFPAFSSSYAQAPERTVQLYHRGLTYVFLILFPITLLIVTFAKEGLLLWVGADFAENSFRPMQILAIGVLLNGTANMPFAFIQGIGRPDITAKFHIMEVILYLPCLWWFIIRYGITGAAIAWMMRVGVDLLLLIFIAKRFFPKSVKSSQNIFGVVTLMFALVPALFSMQFAIKLILFGLTIVGSLFLTWFVIIREDERYYITSKLGIYFK